jgi:large repetitive protein
LEDSAVFWISGVYPGASNPYLSSIYFGILSSRAKKDNFGRHNFVHIHGLCGVQDRRRMRGTMRSFHAAGWSLRPRILMLLLVTATAAVFTTARASESTDSMRRRQRLATTGNATESVGAWIVVNSNATLTARHEACFVMVGSLQRAYLIGGRGVHPVDIYDPVTRRWTVGRETPIELHHMQCVALDEKVWIVSAWTGDYPREKNVANIYIYDPKNDSWSTKPGLPRHRRRGSAAAVVVGRRIYVSHGNRGGHETFLHARTLGWLDYYNVDTNTWTTCLPNAPNPRDHTGGALIVTNVNDTNKNRRLLCVAGGRDGGKRKFFNRVILPTDCFDLETNEWSVHTNIPHGRAGSSYGTTCDGKLILAGGEGFGQAFANVDVFDGTTWTTWPSLQIARHGSGLAVDCACLQIYLASGAATQGGAKEIASVETFFPNGIDVACLP